MVRLMSLFVFLLTPLTALACGAPSDPVKGFQAVWRANCDAIVTCVDQAPEEDWDWIQIRADECVDGGGVDPQWAESIRLGVDEGRILYNRDAAKSCLQFYKEAECATIWDEPVSSDCGSYLLGTLACDSNCSVNEECESGVCRGMQCDCST